MIPLRLADIAGLVDGELHDLGPEGADTLVEAPASIDSREVEPGGLFVAFDGEHVDGHDYAAAAVRQGAAAVLCSRPVGVPAVVVPDVQLALGKLATALLAQLTRCTVIALTGSQGKTSTKDLLAGVLGAVAPTVATAGSFNNEIGLPLTVLRADAGTRYLIVEMGARGVGHIATLCAIAKPDVAVVLNVGKAHLGEFGSQEAIAVAKGELVEALGPGGVAVLNADDPRVLAMSERAGAGVRVSTFGQADGAEMQWVNVSMDSDGRASFSLRTVDDEPTSAQVALQLVGDHHVANAAAACAAALAAAPQIPLEFVTGRLAQVRELSKWRMEVTTTASGVRVINDSYNANPDSMAAGLRALAALGTATTTLPNTSPVGVETIRRWAVLGEMKELGESSAHEHFEVGRLAASIGIDMIIAVGSEAGSIIDGARSAGAAKEATKAVSDHHEALSLLRAGLAASDVVLVKASRAAGLDRVALGLTDGVNP